MKLVFLLFAVFGVSLAAPATRSLRTDFDEILALIPVDEIKAIYHKFENDEDIKKVVAYLKSEDFAKVVKIIEGVEEVNDMIKYLEERGIKVVDLMNKIADLLGLPHYPGSYITQFSNDMQKDETRTWRDFIDAVVAVLPKDKLIEKFLELLSNSADFQELFEKISNLDYQKLHDNALKHPEIVDALDRLKAMGVDVSKVWEMIKSIFGWEYSSVRQSRSLRTDMDELIALIPTQKIKEIYLKYRNDPDMVKIVAYLKSKDFAAVAHIVANVPEIQDMVNYLESKQIKAIEYLNKAADLLGLPHWPGSFSVYSSSLQSRTWRQFYDEVKAALPMDDLIAFFLDKLSNSADFQELYEKIAGLDYQKLHDNALKHPEIVDMITRAQNMGVDTKKIWDTIKSIFGWE